LSSGEVVVFAASSFGGKHAIADLCSAYAKRTQKTGCGQPIIKLATAPMMTKKFGKVPRPDFTVTGWDQERVGIEVISPTATEADSMSDEIPF